MVLHPRQDDAVAGAEVGAAPGLGHEVDAVGASAHKQDFPGRGRAKVGADGLARAFVRLRRLLRQGVDAPVNVAVRMREVAGLRVDDGLGFLGGRRAVEIRQRLAVHLPRKDGERARMA